MTTYCTNLRTGEMTEYDHYDFLAFGRLGTRVFGLKVDGLYALGGESDDGVRIEAAARLHEYDCAKAERGAERAEKRATALYVEGDVGTLAVTPYADGQAVGRFFGQRRVKLARGPRGLHWAFELENVGGGDVRIEAVTVLVEVLRRGR